MTATIRRSFRSLSANPQDWFELPRRHRPGGMSFGSVWDWQEQNLRNASTARWRLIWYVLFSHLRGICGWICAVAQRSWMPGSPCVTTHIRISRSPDDSNAPQICWVRLAGVVVRMNDHLLRGIEFEEGPTTCPLTPKCRRHGSPKAIVLVLRTSTSEDSLGRLCLSCWSSL